MYRSSSFEMESKSQTSVKAIKDDKTNEGNEDKKEENINGTLPP